MPSTIQQYSEILCFLRLVGSVQLATTSLCCVSHPPEWPLQSAPCPQSCPLNPFTCPSRRWHGITAAWCIHVSCMARPCYSCICAFPARPSCALRTAHTCLASLPFHPRIPCLCRHHRPSRLSTPNVRAVPTLPAAASWSPSPTTTLGPSRRSTTPNAVRCGHAEVVWAFVEVALKLAHGSSRYEPCSGCCLEVVLLVWSGWICERHIHHSTLRFNLAIHTSFCW